MPTTTGGLPYPALTDAPDVPYWVQQLAQAVEARMLTQTSGVRKRVHRFESSGVTTDASGFATITHGAPFTPTVVVLASRAAGTSFAIPWGADNFTSTQARLRFTDSRPSAPATGAYVGATGAFTAFLYE